VFPYHDENETLRPAVVTIGVIAACVATWILVQGAGLPQTVAASVCNYGLVPAELMGALPAGTAFPMGPDMACVIDSGREVQHVVTSMFLHGSWMHLLGNMWFLWIFGNNIEDAMTRPRFVAFYLLCGVAAAVLQVAAEPASGIPMVGASGAISGVMGAYIVLYPRVRVHTLIFLFYFIRVVALPAVALLGVWFAMQLLEGASNRAGGGVAFWAHVGGFLAGVGLIRLFARPPDGTGARPRVVMTREQFDRWNRG
jgi:rhomboid family protein